MDRLGLIAGGGELPQAVAAACEAAGGAPFIVRLEGFADRGLAAWEGVELNIGEIGAAMAALREQRCRRLCFAGSVGRADFAALRLDSRGREILPRAASAARAGDGALLSFLLAEFEQQGFEIVAAQTVAAGLLLGEGACTRRRPTPEDRADIRRAMTVARAIGAVDVGQGAVCRSGRVLAVEAQEGTDAMLRRAGALIGAHLHDQRRGGVLAKAPKPRQDRRVDLPVIGPTTVREAAAAGLAGIAGEAGGVLLVDRDETVGLADSLDLFLTGWPGDDADDA